MMSKVAHLFTLIHTVVRKPRFGLAHIWYTRTHVSTTLEFLPCLHIFQHTHKHKHPHSHTYIHTHARAHTHTHTHIYTHTHTGTHTYDHIHTLSHIRCKLLTPSKLYRHPEIGLFKVALSLLTSFI
jgi:hypothetical protein